MRRTAVALILASIVVAGCGAAKDKSENRVALSPAEVETPITGATPEQEALLREIIAGLGRETLVRSVLLRPPTTGEAGVVGIDVRVAARNEVRADWERSLVVDAFAARSRAAGLPRVRQEFVNRALNSTLDSGNPIQRRPIDADEISSAVIAGAEVSGARLLELELLQPNNLAASVTLVVDDPARYLDERLGSFVARLETPDAARFDGLFIEVVDTNGALVWSHSHTVSEDGGEELWGDVRPGLEGCAPEFDVGGPPARVLPPCPIEPKPGAATPSQTETKIIGATPKQEAILREIIEGLAPTIVEEVRVGPAGHPWTPYKPNSVVVAVKYAAPAERGRGEWEAALLGSAFATRSRALGLQPVAAYESPTGGSALDGPEEPEPETRREISREELADAVSDAAHASGADILELRSVQPMNPAVVLTLRVAEPAAFLRHRAEPFLESLPGSSEWGFDGLYVRVVDTEGRFVWLFATMNGDAVSGSQLGVRPDLRGCDPIPRIGVSPHDPEPPPCPAN